MTINKTVKLNSTHVLADLPNFFEDKEEEEEAKEEDGDDKSPDRLRSNCRMPSATLTAGFALNLLQNAI